MLTSMQTGEQGIPCRVSTIFCFTYIAALGYYNASASKEFKHSRISGSYAGFLKGGFDNFFGKLLIMRCNLNYTCKVGWP